MGLGAAVIVNRQVVWMKGYGFADWQRTRPFTPNTIMNVGSIAKPFVGVAMMRAVQEGKLSLDEDINTYLPFRVVNPHHPNEKITLRHLATHTSGITDRWEVYAGTYHYGGDSPEPLGHFLEQYFTPDGKYYSRDNFLDAKPGARATTPTSGPASPGYIVERAFGEPLNVYTRKHIFTPLRNDGHRVVPVRGGPARITPRCSSRRTASPFPSRSMAAPPTRMAESAPRSRISRSSSSPC